MWRLRARASARIFMPRVMPVVMPHIPEQISYASIHNDARTVSDLSYCVNGPCVCVRARVRALRWSEARDLVRGVAVVVGEHACIFTPLIEPSRLCRTRKRVRTRTHARTPRAKLIIMIFLLYLCLALSISLCLCISLSFTLTFSILS